MERILAKDLDLISMTYFGLEKKIPSIFTAEGIASLIRRAAFFMCPCSTKILLESVVFSLKGLSGRTSEQLIEDTLEQLIVHGDIIESLEENEKGIRRTRILFNAPPTFIKRESQKIMLFGIYPEFSASVLSDFECDVSHTNLVRNITSNKKEEIAVYLTENGFTELPLNIWLECPSFESSKNLISRMNEILNKSSQSGNINNLKILDPNTPVRYYNNRWLSRAKNDGLYVSRREQSFGSDLWCYVKIENGQSNKFIDFPLVGDKWRGCDWAWYLQAAIDANNGKAQQFRVSPVESEKIKLDFFSPIPSWFIRRLDLFGAKTDSHTCLFSYVLPEKEANEEIDYLKKHLWLEPFSN